MTKEKIFDDLSYARKIAEDGADTPLLGGRIGLMWGILLVPTLLFTGLVNMGSIDFPKQSIGFVWMCFGIAGGIFTAVLGRSLEKKPGAHSLSNRIEQATWVGTTLLMFSFAIATAYAVVASGKPYWLYDVILALAFGTYIVNYYVLAQITRQKSHYIPMTIALALTIYMMTNLGNPHIYVVAAIGVVFTIVIPSFLSLRNEPKNV